MLGYEFFFFFWDVFDFEYRVVRIEDGGVMSDVWNFIKRYFGLVRLLCSWIRF